MKKILLGIIVLCILAFNVSADNFDNSNKFKGLVGASDDNLTVFEGFYAGEDGKLKGHSVDIYCNHSGSVNLLKKVKTDNEGFFETFVLNSNKNKLCYAGDDAWVVINNEKSYRVEVQRHNENHNHGTIAVGVPEFNAYTLGLAILGSIFGVVALRRE